MPLGRRPDHEAALVCFSRSSRGLIVLPIGESAALPRRAATFFSGCGGATSEQSKTKQPCPIVDAPRRNPGMLVGSMGCVGGWYRVLCP